MPGSELQPFAGQHILAILIELGGRAIEADQHILAREIARCLNGLHNELQGVGVAGQIGSKTAFVTHRRRETLLVEQLLQRVENFRTAPQRLTEGALAHRQDHELLKIQAVVGMFAAIDDVHHGYWHLHRARSAEIAIQGQSGLLGGRLGDSHRDGENGICPQPRLVLRAIKLNQCLIDERLLLSVQADNGFRDLCIDVLDGLGDAFTVVACCIAIAQFDGLARSGRRTGRHRGTAHDTGFQQHIAFDGGIAAGIENLASNDIND